MSRLGTRLHAALRGLLELVTIGLMVALAVLVVAAVVFRKLGAPLAWYDEVAAILLAWLTYYGAALAALHGAHIGVPTFVRRLSPAVQGRVFALRTAIVISFFAVAAWAGWRVFRVLGGSTLVSVPWMPARVTQSVIPVGAILFILAELVRLLASREDTDSTSGSPR